MEVSEKFLELMRTLTAAQAALWDVIDNPDAPGPRTMLGIMSARVARLGADIASGPTRKGH
jgi:hypothetical protein